MMIKKDCDKKTISCLEKSLKLEDGVLNEKSFEQETPKNKTPENNAPSGPEDTIVSDMIRRYTTIYGLPKGYKPY